MLRKGRRSVKAFTFKIFIHKLLEAGGLLHSSEYIINVLAW
jgi:hypothetical protein